MSRIMEVDVPDFKHPQEPMASVQSSQSSDKCDGYFGENGTGTTGGFPLRTPDRRLLSSENTSLGVRKRLLSPSSPDPHCLDEKRRNVAKSLFGDDGSIDSADSGEKKVGKAVKCLFGTPSQEENDQTLKDYQTQRQNEYEAFTERYKIIGKVERDLV